MLYAYRSSPQKSTGLTPNFLMLGRETESPIDSILGLPPATPKCQHWYALEMQEALQKAYQMARIAMGTASANQKKLYDVGRRPRNYMVGEWCWYGYPPLLRKKLACPWKGPYKITRKLNEVTVQLQRFKRSAPFFAHVDQIKPYWGENIPVWEDENDQEDQSGLEMELGIQNGEDETLLRTARQQREEFMPEISTTRRGRRTVIPERLRRQVLTPIVEESWTPTAPSVEVEESSPPVVHPVELEELSPPTISPEEEGEDHLNKCAVEPCRRPTGAEIGWIQCEECLKWYHFGCLGQSELIIAEKAVDDELRYDCWNCRINEEGDSDFEGLGELRGQTDEELPEYVTENNATLDLPKLSYYGNTENRIKESRPMGGEPPVLAFHGTVNVECEVCNKWFQGSCLGHDEYQRALKVVKGEEAYFICDGCRTKDALQETRRTKYGRKRQRPAYLSEYQIAFTENDYTALGEV